LRIQFFSKFDITFFNSPIHREIIQLWLSGEDPINTDNIKLKDYYFTLLSDGVSRYLTIDDCLAGLQKMIYIAIVRFNSYLDALISNAEKANDVNAIQELFQLRSHLLELGNHLSAVEENIHHVKAELDRIKNLIEKKEAA